MNGPKIEQIPGAKKELLRRNGGKFYLEVPTKKRPRVVNVASNVQVCQHPKYPGLCEVYFEWYCAACHEVHWSVEGCINLSLKDDGRWGVGLERLGIELSCSSTLVYMPWAQYREDNPKRSKTSIYGQAPKRCGYFVKRSDFGHEAAVTLYIEQGAEERDEASQSEELSCELNREVAAQIQEKP